MDALSVQTVSLTFQVFAGCIEGYQSICDAKGLPSDLNHLRVRLKTEQYRLLDWANVVRLDVNDDHLQISNSNKGLLLDVLEKQRRLLRQFGRLDDKYKKLARPLLSEDIEPQNLDQDISVSKSQAALPDSNPATDLRKPISVLPTQDEARSISGSTSKTDSSFTIRFPQSGDLLQKSLEYAKKTDGSVKRLRWTTVDRAKLENLVLKLASFNDFMREMLHGSQLESLAIKQTRTQFQIMQLNSSVQNLIEIFESTQIKQLWGTRRRRDKRVDNPVRAYLQAQGLEDIEEEETTKPGLPGLAALAQFKILNSALKELDSYEDVTTESVNVVGEESDTQTLVSNTVDLSKEITLDYIPETNNEVAEVEFVEEELEVDQMPDIPSTTHMLLEKADVLSRGNWKDLLDLLPENLRLSLKYDEVVGTPSWTFIPNPSLAPASIPLTIAGVPVVVPLKYRNPLRAASAAPPDPRPFRIDPIKMVDDPIVEDIFSTFEGIHGFYLLINGFLQLIVPLDFDIEDALTRYPSRFGGLKVSYIRLSMLSTGSSGETPATTSPVRRKITTTDLGTFAQSPTMTSERTLAWTQSSASASRSFANRTPITTGLAQQLDFSNTLRARVKKQRSPSWFGGKPGVLTKSGSKIFVTISTHIATQALDETKYKFQSNSSWTDKVEIYHGNFKVGDVVETFDDLVDAKFPDGIEHDVSLVDVTDKNGIVLEGLKAPKDCTWLSAEEWTGTRLMKSKIGLLQNETIRSKTIALSESREQLVGQGIFKNIQDSRSRLQAWNARRRGESSSEEISKWSTVISRAVLYRVDPDFEEPRANSGTAICLIEDSGACKVAGFQSFVQEVDGGQYYELEEDPFLDMLRLGAVAFYGAFQVPDKLRDTHTIVTEE